MSDNNGKFQAGGPGGPGRPPKQVEDERLQVALGECSLEEWRKIVRRAKLGAINGNALDRSWLSKWFLKPATQAQLATEPQAESQQPIDPEKSTNHWHGPRAPKGRAVV